jgi:hypothetical protein
MGILMSKTKRQQERESILAALSGHVQQWAVCRKRTSTRVTRHSGVKVEKVIVRHYLCHGDDPKSPDDFEWMPPDMAGESVVKHTEAQAELACDGFRDRDRGRSHVWKYCVEPLG